MPYVRSRYYREEEKPAGYRRVEAGFGLLEKNTLFHQLDGYITAKPSHLNAKGSLYQPHESWQKHPSRRVHP